MSSRFPTKQPIEVLDYDFDFTNWLGTDTIASATVVVDDVSLTLGATSFTTKIVKQWASAGTSGITYKFSCTIVTAGGRTRQVDVQLPVKEL